MHFGALPVQTVRTLSTRGVTVQVHRYRLLDVRPAIVHANLSNCLCVAISANESHA